MRIVIDISKDRYDEIMSMDWKNCRLIFDEEIRAIHDGKVIEQAICKDVDFVSVRQELLDRGDEMVSFRQLVERFDEVESYFKGIPWNLKQIYNNFNILIGEKPCEDCVSGRRMEG